MNEQSELSLLRAELRRAQAREKELFEENMKLRSQVEAMLFEKEKTQV